MNTDLTFFTNEADATLLDRFRAMLRDVQFFDVLAGFFRSSGFHVWAFATSQSCGQEILERLVQKPST